jgi:hypothetical protein
MNEKLEAVKISGDAVFKIIGIVIPALIALGILDPTNKIVKIWDKIGDLQKKITLFKKK